MASIRIFRNSQIQIKHGHHPKSVNRRFKLLPEDHKKRFKLMELSGLDEKEVEEAFYLWVCVQNHHTWNYQRGHNEVGDAQSQDHWGWYPQHYPPGRTVLCSLKINLISHYCSLINYNIGGAYHEEKPEQSRQSIAYWNLWMKYLELKLIIVNCLLNYHQK